MAGGVRRPSLAALRPDWRTTRFFLKIGMRAMTDFGDDRLFRAIIGELEVEGFRVVGADSILSNLVAPKGLLGRVAPDAERRSRYPRRHRSGPRPRRAGFGAGRGDARRRRRRS